MVFVSGARLLSPSRSLSHPPPTVASAKSANQSHFVSPRSTSFEQNHTAWKKQPRGPPRPEVRKIPFCWPLSAASRRLKQEWVLPPRSIATHPYLFCYPGAHVWSYFYSYLLQIKTVTPGKREAHKTLRVRDRQRKPFPEVTKAANSWGRGGGGRAGGGGGGQRGQWDRVGSRGLSVTWLPLSYPGSYE